LILIVLWGLLLVACSSSRGAAYHGKVVDAETGEPIEGAVVVVAWHKKPFLAMDGPQYFHNAREVLTDAGGKFSVDASPGIDWNPLTYVVKPPWIAIFKPGYGPFPIGHVREVSIEETKQTLLEKGAVIKLPRLRIEDELRKYVSPSDLLFFSTCHPSLPEGQCVPLERIPNLLRLTNVQAKTLGLQPLPESFEGEQKPLKK
jgi:hypothetical protein